MSSSFEDIILSLPFTFIIGKEKKTIVVHANAIAATCDQMNVLINGNMNEANTRCVEIENVEVEDFIRFCEYAYRGDFTVPTWRQDETSSADEESPETVAEPTLDGWGELSEPLLEEPQVAEPPVEEPLVAEPPVDDGWGSFSTQVVSKKEKKKGKKNAPINVNLRDIFKNRSYQSYHNNLKFEIQGKSSPYANHTANQDFTPVFLAYARLYTFAHFRSIEPLKALTLQKLHSTLKGFKIYHKRVGDIVKLAEYAYTADDLPSRGENGTIDSLRRLVVQYIVCEINTIGRCRRFVEFMEEGGEFVGDFWRIMRRYNLFL